MRWNNGTVVICPSTLFSQPVSSVLIAIPPKANWNCSSVPSGAFFTVSAPKTSEKILPISLAAKCMRSPAKIRFSSPISAGAPSSRPVCRLISAWPFLPLPRALTSVYIHAATTKAVITFSCGTRLPLSSRGKNWVQSLNQTSFGWPARRFLPLIMRGMPVRFCLTVGAITSWNVLKANKAAICSLVSWASSVKPSSSLASSVSILFGSEKSFLKKFGIVTKGRAVPSPRCFLFTM